MMPAVTRGLKFWSHPLRRSLGLKTDLIGIVLISLALGMMVIFSIKSAADRFARSS
jgi:hypothetical protein